MFSAGSPHVRVPQRPAFGGAGLPHVRAPQKPAFGGAGLPHVRVPQRPASGGAGHLVSQNIELSPLPEDINGEPNRG